MITAIEKNQNWNFVNLQIKQAIGHKAAGLVQHGMRVGLGTGSTATCFIEALVERVRQGLRITAACTSQRSAEIARAGGIQVIDNNLLTHLDLTIDGADEIDPQKRLIKGGGGALLREKIIAYASSEMVVIVDSSKLVKNLGRFGLPVEIIPFGYLATLSRMNQLGFNTKLRLQDGKPYMTDNQNYIVDIHFASVTSTPETDHAKLHSIPGVVETGFFLDIAGRVIVGFDDGHVELYDNLPSTLPFR